MDLIDDQIVAQLHRFSDRPIEPADAPAHGGQEPEHFGVVHPQSGRRFEARQKQGDTGSHAHPQRQRNQQPPDHRRDDGGRLTKARSKWRHVGFLRAGIFAALRAAGKLRLGKAVYPQPAMLVGTARPFPVIPLGDTAMLRTGNPALNDTTFENFGVYQRNSEAEKLQLGVMTINGTAQKTMFLLALAMGTACFTWSQTFSTLEANPAAALPWAMGGAIVGMITALAICFKHTWAPMLAPVYALAEGLFLGGVSASFEAQYPGIVIQAVGGTFGTLFGLLMAYQSGLIKATENFKLGVVAATGGIFLVYMISMIGSFFGFPIPFIHSAGPMGIAFSLFVVVVAALNLVLDFDFIEQAAERGAPKYLEWYGAFALMVTLVWLYMEILRLLSKLRSRN